MECLNVTITNDYSPIEASIILSTKPLFSKISILDNNLNIKLCLHNEFLVLLSKIDTIPISALLSKIDNAPKIEIKNTSKKLRASVGLICSLEQIKEYLEVEPEYVWLVPSNNYSQDVIIYSNTNWTIN